MPSAPPHQAEFHGEPEEPRKRADDAGQPARAFGFVAYLRSHAGGRVGAISETHQRIGESLAGVHGHVAGDIVEYVGFGQIVHAVGRADGDGGGEFAAPQAIEKQKPGYIAADSFGLEAGERPQPLVDFRKVRNVVGRQLRGPRRRGGNHRWRSAPIVAECARRAFARTPGFPRNIVRRLGECTVPLGCVLPRRKARDRWLVPAQTASMAYTLARNPVLIQSYQNITTSCKWCYLATDSPAGLAQYHHHGGSQPPGAADFFYFSASYKWQASLHNERPGPGKGHKQEETMKTKLIALTLLAAGGLFAQFA